MSEHLQPLIGRCILVLQLARRRFYFLHRSHALSKGYDEVLRASTLTESSSKIPLRFDC